MVKKKKPAASLPGQKRVSTKATKKPAAKKTSTTAKRRPPVKFLFRPPSDFKPHFLDLLFRTGPDGLMSPQIKIAHVVGSIKTLEEEKKRNDLVEFDPVTAMAFLTRFGGKMFSASTGYEDRKTGTATPEKRRRLLPNQTYRVILRVNASKDNTSKKVGAKKLTVLVKAIGRVSKSAKTGKMRLFWLTPEKHKKDPDWRRIRAVAKHLAGAFVNSQLPPRRTRRKAAEDE